jgi:hypothetical protein
MMRIRVPELTIDVSDRCLFRSGALALVVLALCVSWPARAQNAANPAEAASRRSPAPPEFHYVRTLPAPTEVSLFGMPPSSTSRLTWSMDGERLAAYVRAGTGIMLWSADGKYQYEFPKRFRFGRDARVLGFLSGHSQLIVRPVARTSDSEEDAKVEQYAFSVLEAETGKLIHSVPAPNPGAPDPGMTIRENIAQHQAISPDQSLVAVIFHRRAGSSVEVFSSRAWQRVAEFDIEEKNGSAAQASVTQASVARASMAQALAFSPDGKKLAVARGLSRRVDVFEVGSWKLLRSIDAFPETRPAVPAASVRAIAFSPDSTMIAVGSSPGSRREYLDGRSEKSGTRRLVEGVQRDSLGVFRVEDGAWVASVGDFPGGITDEQNLAWVPGGEFIAFLDADRSLRLWSPTHPAPSTVAAKFGQRPGWLVFSPDGSQLAINFADGIKLFDVAARREK